MALIDCPECGKQISSEAPTCPGCGVPIAQSVRGALRKTGELKPKKKPMTRNTRIAVVAGALLFIALLIFGDSGPPQSSTPTKEARETNQAQLCDRYKSGIKAAMPDLFNGDVRREIECSGNAIGTTIKGPARRQPHADVVLAAMVRGLVDRGVNPRRDEVILTLHIYQTGETVTGGPGLRKLTSASYSPTADSIEDDTAEWHRKKWYEP